MELNYNVTGAERKRLVEAISTHTQSAAKYQGAPTFAYTVDYFTIDRNGCVSFDDRADSEEIEGLVEALAAQGFVAAEPAAEQDATEPATEQETVGPTEDASEQVETTAEAAADTVGLTVTMPAASFTASAQNNLHTLIASKRTLICRALGLESLPVQVTEETISFPWFEGGLDADEAHTYAHFITALCDMAKNQKRITAKEKETDNEKYAFRCFLLRLGFIGAEYKQERKILLRNLTGSGAFKSGKKGTVNDAVSE